MSATKAGSEAIELADLREENVALCRDVMREFEISDNLAAENERLRNALGEIADSDDVENMLDPARNKRVARAALGDQP